MKWRRNILLPVAAAAAFAGLPQWLEDVPSLPRFGGVFFRPVQMPGGIVLARRPPADSRPILAKLIAGSPNDAELHALAGREAEEQLDFDAAEAEWKRFAELAAERATGQLGLADFYHRRLRPQEELAALQAAASLPSPEGEKFIPAREHRAWKAFERAAALVDAQALGGDAALAVHRAWAARYPAEPAAYQALLRVAVERREFAAADEAIGAYEKAFPADRVFPVSARASLAGSRGRPQDALAVYDKAFEPLWPPELVKEYFGRLQAARGLRSFLERARAAQAANPADLNAAVRVFYYFQQQGNLPAAQRALVEFRLRKDARKSAWKPGELLTIARLLEAVQNYDEAARGYYAAYALAGAHREAALGGVVNLLLDAPEQPIQFGSGNLSFYRDVTTMDPYPGFLNGIASLLLNSTGPEWRYEQANAASLAYFHRTRAAELLELFDARFPGAARRSSLHAKLIQAYATHGANTGVISAGRRYLAAFPDAPQRTEVAMLTADAYARTGKVNDEFAAYEAMLKELAARAGGVPLGSGAAAPPQPPQEEGEQPPPPMLNPTGARSPEYARVLDRYIARLLSLKRPMEALKLLRAELDRNPNDPGLYERLALFLEQNRLGAEIEQVYRRAIQQFQARSWYDKLARWYLRGQQAAQLDKLTREVVDIFSGSEVEQYISGIAGQGPLGAVLYRQVNLYAHERFPYHLTFVRNLLSAYSRQETRDSAAFERLLRNYWYYDDRLRASFFSMLAATRRLDGEVQQVRGQTGNPAATRFAAEAEAWRSHFEEAAPLLESVCTNQPAGADIARRAAMLDRSLAKIDDAVRIEERLSRFAPRDTAVLTRMGEIYADREQFDRARPLWDRIPAIAPGKPDGYLEAATVFWDYFLYDDALRIIGDARAKLGKPALFAYEAGAIYENRREYARAIEEYAKDAGAGTQSRARLIQLAGRPAHRALVEKMTADVPFRIAVLETQNRRADLEQFLIATAGGTSSLELLALARDTAARHGMGPAEERALQREIAVTADPVERTRLRLALMRFHEGRQQTARARETVEALHREQPLILGVVRAAVDFYWRNKLPANAVDALARAAGASNPALRKAFTFEAASKANDSGDYGRARTLLAELLKQEPFRAEYLAAMADTHARQGDDAGLRKYYESTLDALRAAQLGADEKKARLAAMRRGLIPVLTRQKEFTGALDQYIEVLRGYPEDDALARDAAAYASAHTQRDRLLAYFRKAVADSTRDYRWPLVLARLETAFEDFPAAIAAYNAAAGVRPDRTDILSARAALEERLMRFDDALASYTKLYDLTYRNPVWMRKAAEVHARRREADAAAKALRVALIEGRPERPEAFFEAARLLESWDLLPQARQFAERGVELAGDNLVTDHFPGAQVYARVMTRLRAHEQAFARLAESEQVLQAMGAAAALCFTPEEKTALEAFLEKQPRGPAALAVAQHGGLAALEARFRLDMLKAEPAGPRAGMHESRLIELQRRRMQFLELGRQLEEYWQVYPRTPDRDRLLEQAAESYRLGSQTSEELRALALKFRNSGLAGPGLERYFELLLANDPKQLAAIAALRLAPELRNAAANFAVASGNAAVALEVVAARGEGLPPVWRRANLALAGLHYTAPVDGEFSAALGGGTIGERAGRTVDRSQQLAGTDWFYYGTAWGEYLTATRRSGAEEYLPAILEGAPARAPAYFALAEYYSDVRQSGRAIEEYEHALELEPLRADIHDRVANLLWDQDKRKEAAERWRAALATWQKAQEGRLPQNFWNGVGDTLESIGRRGLLPELRSEADRVLRTYFRRNGSYQAEPLLRGALAAAGGDVAGGVSWIADLSRAASDPVALLATALEGNWVPEARREPLYQRILEAAAAQQFVYGGTLRYWHVRWVAHLVETKQAGRARAALDTLPAEARAEFSREVPVLEVRIAAQMGALPALLDHYAGEPEKSPAPELLREAAAALRSSGDQAGARRVLEYVYTRQLESGDLSAANFLGLAEVRFQEGDAAAGVALLRRMALVSGEPFETLRAGADLLATAGRTKEAFEFLEARARAVPWDYEARLKLGELKIAAIPEAPYALRAEAARQAKGGRFGSAELDLLSSGAVAERPFFYHARIEAARRATDNAVRTRLLEGALAIAPAEDAPRLPLMRAALAAGQYQQAISAMLPLENSYWGDQFLAGTKFSPGERAEIARSLAQAHAKLNRTAAALGLYAVALRLEPSKQVEAEAERLRTEERREAENARRRPVITAGVQQERLVMTRLAGGAQ